MPAVLSLTGLSRSTIYRLISAGEFPAGIRLTQHTTAWAASEVTNWIQSRISSRPGA
ncbi:MAG: AlpA family phage regulatory protein [Xanthomonadales bacterium]|nr:AlpA family phage regulatory protein [Xanthomonadales bacterium]